MNLKKNFIACVAGKSGGHIIPGLTYTQSFVKKNPEYNIVFFSTTTKLDSNIINLYQDIMYIQLKLSNFNKTNFFKYPIFFIQFFIAFCKSIKILNKLKPEKLVSMGGYISLPVCIAAYMLKIKIELFELNAVPGKAVNLLKFLSSKINICFSQAIKFFPASKVYLVNYPIRFVLNKSKNNKKDLNYKTILVLGGSQGSKFINNIIIDFIKLNKNKLDSVRFIHQTGTQDLEKVKTFYSSNNIISTVFDYNHDIESCYLKSDLIISRAGAGALFELKFFNKKSIIIPLETKANKHQVDNAQAMAELNPELFTVLKQNSIIKSKISFFKIINKILKLN